MNTDKQKNTPILFLSILGLLLVMIIIIWFALTHPKVESQPFDQSTDQTSEQVNQVNETTSAETQPLVHEFLYEGLDKKDQTQSFQGQDNTLVLRSVGDVLIHDRVSFLADSNSPIYQETYQNLVNEGFDSSLFEPDAEYDFMPMLVYIQPYLEYADVTVAHLEVPAAHPSIPVSGYPQFNAPYQILSALKKIGVDLVSNASNHTLDWHSQGVQETIANLNDADLMYFGSYRSWEDYQTPRIIEKNGISLGFLSYSYGTNGIPIPPGEEYLINLIDLPIMLAEVEQLSQQVDAVVVSLQLGEEYGTLPNQDQLTVFQALSDAGVKLILGAHPHVLQPLDWYNQDQTFAIYSQASFLTGQRELDNKQGGITEVTFIKDDQGKVQVTQPKFMPIFNLGIEGEKMYQVVPYADINRHQIPEGQAWWEILADRMTTYTDHFSLVTHLETESSYESTSIFR